MKYANEEEILAEQDDPVKYNNEVIYPDKVRINLEYLHNRTFWLDLKLIIYTVLGKKLEDGRQKTEVRGRKSGKF
jgi:lipopolysaccharide/colanic/teichoic acid biosynthesis glycosyltransferase